MVNSTGDTGLSVTFIGINYAPEPFGVAPYATGLCTGLVERGYDVRVVTGIPNYPEWKIPPQYRWKWTSFETIDGIRVKRVRHSVPKSPTNSRRLLMEATFGLRAALSNWAKPDVLVCANPALLGTALVCLRNIASPMHRPALGIWVQDLYARGLAETQNVGSTTLRLAAEVESAILRQADAVAVLHDRFRDEVVDNLHVDPAKVTVIRNWTHVESEPVDNRNASRAHFGWSDDETVVLHAGNMGVKQGLENVVRAAQIAAENALNIRFVLVGDGNQRHSLEALANGTRNLEFRDPLPDHDFAAVLTAADILLLNERSGVSEMAVASKLSSYFQSGTPVLAATDPAGTAAQEIRDSAAGVVVESGNPLALLDAALSLGADPELRTALGANGIQYAAAELSEKASLDKFDDWLRRLAVSRRVEVSGK